MCHFSSCLGAKCEAPLGCFGERRTNKQPGWNPAALQQQRADCRRATSTCWRWGILVQHSADPETLLPGERQWDSSVWGSRAAHLFSAHLFSPMGEFHLSHLRENGKNQELRLSRAISQSPTLLSEQCPGAANTHSPMLPQSWHSAHLTFSFSLCSSRTSGILKQFPQPPALSLPFSIFTNTSLIGNCL